MRTFALLFMLASLAAAQDPAKSDPEAEALLKKVEAKLQKAKTVTIRASADLQMGKNSFKFDMVLDFKEGNRARMLLTRTTPEGKKETVGSACDGKTLRVRLTDGVKEFVPKADLAEKLREMSLRAPILDLSTGFERGSAPTSLTYSGFAFLPDEKLGDRTARVVSFVAMRGTARIEMKAWIDEKGLELLKREAVEKKENRESRETVTISKVACDVEIPDEAFATTELNEVGKKD
ncbi:MAG: hypothetical protein HYY18_03125 [Planctomycetes bacterium]|nr:hypothetical protein [Planctomycetota bacterium]